MSILVKIAHNFGGKIQMWLKSVQKYLTFEKIPPLPLSVVANTLKIVL